MNTNIILVIVGIIGILLVLKFITKTAFKIAISAVIIIVVGLFIFFKIGNTSKDINMVDVFTKYTIEDLENAYCNSQNKADSLKCVCIIQPIAEDLYERYSEEELAELESKRFKFAAEIVKSLNNKKVFIKERLKENDVDNLLDEFKDDLIENKIFSKIKSNSESEGNY